MSVAGLSPKTPVVTRNLRLLASTPKAVLVADADDLATGAAVETWISRSRILECEPPLPADGTRDYRRRGRPRPIALTTPLFAAQEAELLFDDPPEAR